MVSALKDKHLKTSRFWQTVSAWCHRDLQCWLQFLLNSLLFCI